MQDQADLPDLEDSSPDMLADVAPSWQASLHRQQHTASKGTSTDAQRTCHADVQTTDRCDAGCQASTSGRGVAAASRSRSRQDAQLAAFLQRTAPTMLAALAVNAEGPGPAGRAGPPHARATSACGEGVAECLFTLSAFSSQQACGGSTQAGSSSSTSSDKHRPSAAAGVRANKHGLHVTSLSWSKTGQTLAASFGRYDVRGWCCLPGAVATWNLARLRGDGAGPDRLIDADACVMCCAFHPAEPALLAGGTYNGEVVIWDLSNDDANAQVAKTDVLSELSHREPVTALSWQHSAQEARRHGGGAASHRLFSLGADGRLLVWLWSSGQRLASPIYGYELRMSQPGCDPRLCLAGACMAFCPDASAHQETGLLLVGTEGGQLLRCQVGDINEAALQEFASRAAAAAAAPAPAAPPPGGSSAAPGRPELRSAVLDARHVRCAAPVNGLAACPHHRQLAVAAAGDSTLRVLDVLRGAPLLLLEPCAGGLLSAAWSPSRPCVFAAGSAGGVVYLYDLAAKQRLVQPLAQLSFRDCLPAHASGGAADCRQPGAPHPAAAGSAGGSRPGVACGVDALAFNGSALQAAGLLAAAAGDVVRVWRLPRRLAEPRAGEAKLLRRLVESEDVAGLLRAQCIVTAAAG